MDEREIVYEEVGNYTKYALVEMLINKHKKSFNNLNQIEEVADDILNVLYFPFYTSKNFLFIVLATAIILVGVMNSASLPYIDLKALAS